tara:strand:+ start:291 stop:797 length:507 start_codon:yes stop_codon:yes gene_type:complete
MGMIKKSNTLFFSIFLLLSCFPFFGQQNQETGAKEEVTVIFETPLGAKVPLLCEVARTQTQKARGLMFRKYLPPLRGMIFISEKPEPLTFWMRNTEIPLSIAFISEKNTILSVEDMKPFDESIVTSFTPAKYAIEANLGWFRKYRISSGSKIKILKGNRMKEFRRARR